MYNFKTIMSIIIWLIYIFTHSPPSPRNLKKIFRVFECWLVLSYGIIILIISFLFCCSLFFLNFHLFIYLNIAFTRLCNWLHIPIILAKAIEITEIAHFCLNYFLNALMKLDDLSFVQLFSINLILLFL